jgi:adenosylmethionine-8-amino-7-oxononanoate aminotransferase
VKIKIKKNIGGFLEMSKMEEMNLWYPYAQMKTKDENYHVEWAKGMKIKIKDGKELLDGVASWWCACHGYSNDELNQAAIEQMGKFSHVMLGGLTHTPVKELAKKLVEITPEGLNHVFFSDSGSVGVEVALKMAIQYFSNRGYENKYKIVSLKGGYHGDTFKAMEVGDDPAYHGAFLKLFKDTYHVDQPRGGYDAPENIVEEDISKLEELLKEKHDEIAAFIVEPIIQAACGFNFYSPKYLERAREICDKYDVLLIFDEVATGFGRTGKRFAMNHTNIIPDIVVLGKALTGGYIGHAATIATTKVFEAFYSDSGRDAFMHGPTFMGNPLTCAVSLKSLEIFDRENYLEKIKSIEKQLKDRLGNIKSEKIENVRTLGVTGVIQVKNAKDLKGFQNFAYERGVWLRPFYKYLYTMPPYIITEEELNHIIDVMEEWFRLNP